MKTKMKTMSIISTIVCCGLLLSNCNKDNSSDTTGFLEFEMSNPMASSNSTSRLRTALTNPALTGESTETYLVSLNLIIGDVWVSQGVVKAGEADDLEWIRLTNTTNTELKLFEEYSFSAIEIPAGNYQSIKITFGNGFYRHLQLTSDPSVKYEIPETMGSSDAYVTNYFGPSGNHSLNENRLFQLNAAGEKIGGFSIEADRTAMVSWRLFAGATTPCITYLIDENENLVWDNGIDSMVEADCPQVTYMWDFVVEYQ